MRQVLSQLGIAKSTYYRRRQSFRRRDQPGLHDRPPTRERTWNQILPVERDKVLEIALLFTDWSPHEVNYHITDRAGFSVSEPSVYRLLKSEGLIQAIQQKKFPAGAEYRVKTRRPNQQWQTDATYLLIKNWSWYCLTSVLDDFSRRILAWRIQSAMATGDFGDGIEAVCESVGLSSIPETDRPRLVTDNGSAPISRDFGRCLLR